MYVFNVFVNVCDVSLDKSRWDVFCDRLTCHGTSGAIVCFCNRTDEIVC